VRYLKKHKLVERCAEMGEVLASHLVELLEYPVVGDVRGKGLMQAVEFVKDRRTREPFPRSEKFAERFTENAFNNGLILWSNVGHADGISGDLVMVAPPFIVSDEEIADFIKRFKKSLEQTI